VNVGETQTLKVGDEAPDFELLADPMGEKFRLSDYRGKQAVILNFVPAAFSTVCSAQAPVIEQKRAEFEAQGALPVIIATDGPWVMKAWKEQLGLNYPALSDRFPMGEVSRAYGVLIESRMVSNRVVVVVGKDGRIAWIEQPEKVTDVPDYDPVMACSKG
jgi:peroxiredoxin